MEFKIGAYVDRYIPEIMGREIPFGELRDYIGKTLILKMPRQSAVNYRLIKITSYRENVDRFYTYDNGKYIPSEPYDRIGFSTDSRRGKENSWVSEMYCSNGRLSKDPFPYPESMYELRLPVSCQ